MNFIASFESTAVWQPSVVEFSAPRQITAVEDAPVSSRPAGLMEAQWIRRIAQGDQAAFGSLYDRYSKPLFSFVVKILRDHWDAEDVLQDAFIRIWKKAPGFNLSLGSPFTWVMMVTRHTAIDRLRARQRHLQMFEEITDGTLVDIFGDATWRDGSKESDQAAQIRTAMNELPDEQRRAIELAFFSGLTHFEIAKALEKPLGTIKARIRRGMLQLRAALQQAESKDSKYSLLNH